MGKPENAQWTIAKQSVPTTLSVGVLLVVPSQLGTFDIALAQVVAFGFIGLGLYHLVASNEGHFLRGAFAMTLGIGIQLVIWGLLSFVELLTLWPLSLIIFGVIVVIADTLDDRYYRRGANPT